MNTKKINTIQDQTIKTFLFEIEDRKSVYAGEKLISFEANDKIVEYSSNDGLYHVKYTYAHGIENSYSML